MAGLVGMKLTFAELKKVAAYALEQRIEPQEVLTTDEAAKINKRENLLCRLLGLPAGHQFQVGDRYYPIYCKGRDDDDMAFIRATFEKEDSRIKAEKKAGKK